MSDLDRAATKEKFLHFLEQKGLRITQQRRAIVDTVFGTDQHFTAEQLLEWAREKDSSVSRATVYRTLPLLTESGLVHEMDFGKDYKIYDPNYAEHPNHNHIICKDCDKIVEFESDRLEALENEITSKLDAPIKNSLEILEISKSISEKLEIFQQICLVNLIQTIWWRKTKNIVLVQKLENLKYLLKRNIQPRLAWEITFFKISMEDVWD